MRRVHNRLARWAAENTSPTIVGDSIVTLLAALVGGFLGVTLAIWQMAS